MNKMKKVGKAKHDLFSADGHRAVLQSAIKNLHIWLLTCDEINEFIDSLNHNMAEAVPGIKVEKGKDVYEQYGSYFIIDGQGKFLNVPIGSKDIDFD